MIAVPVILRTLSLRGAKAKGTKDLTAPATVSVGHALRASCHREERRDQAEAASSCVAGSRETPKGGVRPCPVAFL